MGGGRPWICVKVTDQICRCLFTYPCFGWLEWERMCLAAEGYSRAKYLKQRIEGKGDFHSKKHTFPFNQTLGIIEGMSNMY